MTSCGSSRSQCNNASTELESIEVGCMRSSKGIDVARCSGSSPPGRREVFVIEDARHGHQFKVAFESAGNLISYNL